MNKNKQLNCISKKYFVLNTFSCIILIIIYLTMYKENIDDIASDSEMYYWQSSLLNNNISCVYNNKSDVLPSLEDHVPPEKSIYFIETSCRNGLNSREACAVESAAKAHSKWQINVLFSNAITADTMNMSSLTTLKGFHNVKLMKIDIKKIKKFSQLANKIINKSIYPAEQLSHLLRFETLRTWGGVYLDFDVIVVRSFDSLPKNWVARETANSIGSAILAFARDDVGRNFSEAILREINSTFVPNDWSYKGSDTVTRVFRRKCTPRKPVDWSARTCQDFNVFDPTLFYPVGDFQSKVYLREGHLRVGGVYTHHMWNQKTKGAIIHKDSPYARLARRFCPRIYKTFGQMFGEDGI
ncbi:lactosylceramide 4-alpha-galactosyltransferase [Manduca sexta]|uniref:lactosylceramide 4-alpha-galactosyltransferase n=1 Tax=Manduca sexta TaxID=7130 RepID=UPI00188EED9F|nr:lactosylceramide 4-alpha-galactosyltransferase [Manduca sexta]